MRRIRAVSFWRLCGQIGKAATVSSWLLRSLMLLHNRQLTVLVSPPPPPGAINALRRSTSATDRASKLP